MAAIEMGKRKRQNPPSMFCLLNSKESWEGKCRGGPTVIRSHISGDWYISQWKASKLYYTVSENAREHSVQLDISIHLSLSNISLFWKKPRQTHLLDRQNSNGSYPDTTKQWRNAHPMGRCKQTQVWAKGQKSYLSRWVLGGAKCRCLSCRENSV